MLTDRPTISNLPPVVFHRPLSIIARRAEFCRLLDILGNVVGAAATSTGRLPCDVAEWAGTALIAWAERDRAAMRE